jgi:VanZ family protein
LNNLSNQKQIPLKWLIGLSVVLLLIILAAGLKPKGFRLTNKVSWIEDRPGIRFSKYSIAFTNPFNDSTPANISGADGFSMEIALKPASYWGRKFKFILALHNGNDSEQLIMGQWRSWFIVMNGDDYASRRKTKRISADAADAASPSPAARFVTVTSGKDGTRVYLDGELVRTQKDLTLKIPGSDGVRLLLGNSVYGKHPWRGDIYGLALYNYPLSSQKAAFHFSRWSKEQDFTFAREDKPVILYFFDEKGGTKAFDHSGGNRHLEVPLRMQVLKGSILALPWKNYKFNRSFIIDTIVNFIGFMPFGFILFAVLIRFGGNFDKHAIFFTVILCFSVSLVIEIFQAWMPSRSSHVLDLLLNTLGGWMGAMTYRFLGKVKGKSTGRL